MGKMDDQENLIVLLGEKLNILSYHPVYVIDFCAISPHRA